MFTVMVVLNEREEEIVEIAELVRQAAWKAATSASNEIAQQYNNPADLVNTVDFNKVYPKTAYDATHQALYWLIYELRIEDASGSYSGPTDEIMSLLADGITVRDALEAYGARIAR